MDVRKQASGMLAPSSGVVASSGLILAIALLVVFIADSAVHAQATRAKRSKKSRRVCLSNDGSLVYKFARKCPRNTVDATVESLSAAGVQGPQGEKGDTGEQGLQGDTGAQGSQGAQGADGSVLVYGNGSAADLSVPTVTVLQTVNTQYENIVVSAGATLIVPSGTILRATDDCDIQGTITVSTAAQGATRSSGAVGEFIDATVRVANSGIAQGGGNAQLSEQGADGGGVVPGYGGQGVSLAMGNTLVRPQLYGGGGGGTSAFGDGGDGGGFFSLYCQGDIVIGSTAIIEANGGDGASGTGGGGAGVVVVASSSSITLEGAIVAIGGDGGEPHSGAAAGGGGGGGVVHLIAPTIDVTGAYDVSGGTGGQNSTDAGVLVNDSLVAGGGGGGACGGNGGTGGVVFTSGSSSGGSDGGSGYAYETETDPTSLLL